MKPSSLRKKNRLHQNQTKSQGQTIRLRPETTETGGHPLQITTPHLIDRGHTFWNMSAEKGIRLLNQGVLIRSLPIIDAAITTAFSIVTTVTTLNFANN